MARMSISLVAYCLLLTTTINGGRAHTKLPHGSAAARSRSSGGSSSVMCAFVPLFDMLPLGCLWLGDRQRTRRRGRVAPAMGIFDGDFELRWEQKAPPPAAIDFELWLDVRPSAVRTVEDRRTERKAEEVRATAT